MEIINGFEVEGLTKWQGDKLEWLKENESPSFLSSATASQKREWTALVRDARHMFYINAASEKEQKKHFDRIVDALAKLSSAIVSRNEPKRTPEEDKPLVSDLKGRLTTCFNAHPRTNYKQMGIIEALGEHFAKPKITERCKVDRKICVRAGVQEIIEEHEKLTGFYVIEKAVRNFQHIVTDCLKKEGSRDSSYVVVPPKRGYVKIDSRGNVAASGDGSVAIRGEGNVVHSRGSVVLSRRSEDTEMGEAMSYSGVHQTVSGNGNIQISGSGNHVVSSGRY